MVQGDDTLIGEKDFPLVPLNGVFGAGRRREQSLGQGFGQGTARHGDLEGVVTGNTGVLTLNHVCAQGRAKGGDVGEGEEIGLAVVTHHDGSEVGFLRCQTVAVGQGGEERAEYAEAVTRYGVSSKLVWLRCAI